MPDKRNTSFGPKSTPDFPADRIILEAILEHYCEDKGLKPITRKHYRKLIARLEKDTGIRFLDECTLQGMRDWKVLIIDRSSPTNWNGHHRTVSAILNYCHKRNLIAENPLETVKQSPEGNVRGRCCTEEEFRGVVTFLEQDSYPLAPFLLNVFLTLYYTALRRNQICGLEWGDLDFSLKTIYLRKQHSKTGQEWTIPMHEDLHGILLSVREDLTRELGRPPGCNEQVFWVQCYSNRFRGERMSPEQLSGMMKRLSVRTGIRISSHPIRHLVVSTLVNQHADATPDSVPLSLTSVRDFVGHTDIKTTVGYVETSLSTQRKMIKSLRALETPGESGQVRSGTAAASD